MRAVASPSFAVERHRTLVPYSEAYDYLKQAEGVRSILILDSWVPPYYLERPHVKPIGAWSIPDRRCPHRSGRGSAGTSSWSIPRA
jgi:hypothetical protein